MAGGRFLRRQFIDRRIVGLPDRPGAAVAPFALVSLVLSRPWVLIALGATPFLTYLLPRQLELNVDRARQPALCGFVCVAVQLLSGVSGPLLDTFFVPSKLDEGGRGDQEQRRNRSAISPRLVTSAGCHRPTEAVTPMLLAALVIAAVS